MYKIFTKYFNFICLKRRFLMRVSIINIIILISGIQFLIAKNGNSQDLESIMVTIEIKNGQLVDLFHQIEGQTTLKFVYGQYIAKGHMNISIPRGNRTVKSALELGLRGTDLEYQQKSGNIVIYPRNVAEERKEDDRIIPLLHWEIRSIQPLAFKVSGTILDQDGVPLIGVNIQVKGTNKGTATDFDGNFALEDIDENAVLVVSYVGYRTQEVAVAGKSNLTVTLESNSQLLDEVVVVGYGTQIKREVTGAVSQINSSVIEDENPANVQDVLRGNIAGLNVGYNASAKGGGDLLVRGQKSLTAGGDPLLVLDGIIYYGSLSDINPNDISSIDVLKDASAAAVYGAKSANGVILINTKRGKLGKPIINFNVNFGIAELEVDQPIYSAEGFLKWREDVFNSTNSNHFPYEYANPNDLPSNISLNDWLAYDASSGDPAEVWLQRINLQQIEIDNYKKDKSIDWYNQVFQRGIQQDYNISLSNRKDDLSYYLSMGYRNNEGVIVDDKFSAIRAKFNIESKVTDFLTIGANSQFGNRDESQLPASWNEMLRVSPWGSYYADDGKTLRLSPHDEPAISRHPFINSFYTDRLQTYTNFNSALYAVVKLPFDISYQLTFTPYVEWYKYLNHQSSEHPQWALQGGLADRNEVQTYSWQLDNLIKWNKSFNDIHNFDVTLLVNAEKFQSWQNSISTQDFDPSDQLGYNFIGGGLNPEVSSNDEYSTGDALMGRLFYSLKNKYLLTLSVRRDGYSAFGVNNPRAIFPAGSLGWIFTDEPFFNSRWLSFAKLRISYGANGNRDIGRYAAVSRLASDHYLHADQNGSSKSVSTLEVSNMSNTNLKWERTTSTNIGIDYSIFSGIVEGSLEIYNMSTTDLIVARSLPSIVGYKSVLTNLGEVNNKGFEISLGSRNVDRDNFVWTSTLNFSLNRNKIVSLYGDYKDDIDANGNVVGRKERDDVTNKWFIGQDINSIWDLKILGVYQIDDKTAAENYGVKPGDFELDDVNSDGIYSNDDRQYLGFTTPRLRWSLRNNFKLFNNFNVSLLIYSLWGHKDIYNEAKGLGSGYMDRSSSYVLPYWTPENPIDDYARLQSSAGSATYNVYRDKSFIRLGNTAISYTIPNNYINKYNIQDAKISFSINNVGFYSPGTFIWDPENDGPTPRTYTLSINLSI